ncbi:coiled-coil domain-containing protein 12 [Hypomesus transpacificus]|uniref:coiled-coil domain-containing protein 12 n=1 Tax=Hypomesus transpacificus TaxID=137520 RepID=UPI001F077B39|nr:coiled-coil domain-containing protein 12 [Hypomesus transpacificus]XP_046895617.1 coiled-coil domain-containing protein 12 [Hypomesus transpacificus]
MFSTIALDPFSTMNRWLITQKKKQSNVLASKMERSVGSLQEQALKRKERLKALRGRQLQGRDQEQEDGEPERKRALEEEAEAEAEERHRELKLRNYTPADEELKERQVPKAKPASVEDKVKDQLEAANPEPVIEEVDLANLAPRKPDWDLKRDVAKKLEKLEKRTQKAIAELIRDRLRGNEEELAAVVGAVDVTEGDSD